MSVLMAPEAAFRALARAYDRQADAILEKAKREPEEELRAWAEVEAQRLRIQAAIHRDAADDLRSQMAEQGTGPAGETWAERFGGGKR